MGKIKTTPSPKASLPPLATGQVWRVGEMNLEVGMVGPLMVNYKLAKPDAVRIRSTIDGKVAVTAYLKKNKAVLLPAKAATSVVAMKKTPAKK